MRRKRGAEMRVIVFSDTHGNLAAANKIMESNKVCDHFIFLGDGLDELDVIKAMYPEKNIYSVLGNCDKGPAPTSDTVEIFKTRIYFTHGHLCSVRDSHDILIRNAREAGATIILYGHTHIRYYKYEDGLYILNPGSAAQPKDGKPPCYAFFDLTPCGISCAHVNV